MELTITAKRREKFGKQNIKLRKTGILPAVVYGRNKETLPLEVSEKDFKKIYREAGENTLVNLAIDGFPARKVLIHEVAKHFMKDVAVHVDFYEVDLTRKIHSKIPLHFVGTSPAVKEVGAILFKNLNEIEVEALPTELPHAIEINIDVLKNVDDAIHLKDVKVSGDVKILGNPEELIVTVQAPRSEEELAELLETSAADAEKSAIEGLTADLLAGKAGEGKVEGATEASAKAEGEPKPAKPEKAQEKAATKE